MAKQHTYPSRAKVQAYPDWLTYQKLKQLADGQDRSISYLVNNLIYQAVKDVKLEEGK